jgi:membrane fusion protein, multidrug efflux system
MNRLHRRLAFVALGLATFLLGGCGSSEPPLAPTEVPVVTVSQPMEREITDFDQYTGRVEASETVEMRARVRGELKEIFFEDGGLVEKGKTLFEIDPRPYKAALDVAEAKKANAQSSLKLAETEYDRNYRLFQKGGAAATDVEAWLAKKGIALAEVKQADGEIDKARLDLEFCTIKAPITGKISRTLVTRGNLVNAGGGDTLLTTIVSIDPIYVYFDVDEQSLELYRKRRAKELGEKAQEKPVIPVSLGLIGDGDRFPRQGTLDFAENKLNPATGTRRVRGKFANKDEQVTPGLFARVRLPVGEKYAGLLVTDQAVGIDQGQKYLLIVNSENKVEYRAVKPGRLDEDLRIFPPDSGLKPGEWVIVNGVQRVRPGIEVKPERVAMPTRSAPEEKEKAANVSKKKS